MRKGPGSAYDKQNLSMVIYDTYSVTINGHGGDRKTFWVMISI